MWHVCQHLKIVGNSSTFLRAKQNKKTREKKMKKKKKDRNQDEKWNLSLQSHSVLKYDSFESLQIHLSLFFFLSCVLFFFFISMFSFYSFVFCSVAFASLNYVLCLLSLWCFCSCFAEIFIVFHLYISKKLRSKFVSLLLERKRKDNNKNWIYFIQWTVNREKINYIFITSTPSHWDFRMGATALRLYHAVMH